MENINVLSLFDGISCGQIALERTGIKVNNYFASEIDKYAIQVTQHNYPNTKHIGDVTKVNGNDLPKTDLLIGGSPCTNFSVAGNQEGLNVDNVSLDSLQKYIKLKNSGFVFKGQSYLFWEYVRILKEKNPKYFLLENVKMNKKWENMISNELGVDAIKINSALVSGQNRERLYWTNIPNITIPNDKKIKLKDILINDVDDKFYLNDKQIEKAKYLKGKKEINRIKNGFEYTYKEGGMSFPNDLNKKSNCLLASGQPIARTSTYVEDSKGIRRITPNECEILQTVPLDYTSMVSDAQRYKMLGNGWTVDVIVHIFKQLLINNNN